jgi:phosphatidylglycerol:prolipoprotein diacylglycerol transferase
MGLLFGRLANFVNGELWGRVTHVPWGMVFCNAYTPADPATGLCAAGPLPRHPSQLYEALGEGLLLFTVIWLLGTRLNKLRKPGLVMGVFIAGYGILRILVEMVRNPDAQMLPFFKNVITMGQLLSVPMVVAGVWLVWRAIKAPELPAPPVTRPADDKPEAA